MVSRSYADLIVFLMIYIIGRSMLDVCNTEFFILAAFLAFSFLMSYRYAFLLCSNMDYDLVGFHDALLLNSRMVSHPG